MRAIKTGSSRAIFVRITYDWLMPLSDDAELILGLVPESSPIGNKSICKALGWDFQDSRFWTARKELIDAGLVIRGKGNGGSTTRVLPDEVATNPDSDALSTSIQQETDLYQPMLKVLRQGWSSDRGVNPVAVVDTSRQGKKDTGGRWTRPDLVVVTVRQFKYLPGKFLELIKFEVKLLSGLDVMAVYEALSHRRSATHAYVAVYGPDSELSAGAKSRVDEVCSLAREHGIGVIYFSDPDDYETWDEQVAPERHEPDPSDLNNFITVQLKDFHDIIAEAIR